MSDWQHGVKVPPLRTQQILDLTGHIRNSLRLNAEECFPVMPFLELAMPRALPGFNWAVVEGLAGGLEACAFPDGCEENPDGPFIVFPSDVYDAAHAGDGRARLTVLHECGHVLLHQKVAVHHRGSGGEQLRAYENSEWQAHTFAGGLLMTPQGFQAHSSLQGFCRAMGVSKQAALVHGKRLVRDRALPPLQWLVG